MVINSAAKAQKKWISFMSSITKIVYELFRKWFQMDIVQKFMVQNRRNGQNMGLKV